jgi:hypothetical protein
MTSLGPDLSSRPFYFVEPSGRLNPLRLPTLAGLVEVLSRQEPGTLGYRRGCYGPVAEVCKGRRVRLFTDVPQDVPRRQCRRGTLSPARKVV